MASIFSSTIVSLEKQMVELPTVEGGRATVVFPLEDGTALIDSKALTYAQDGLATKHNSDFMTEPRFARTYDIGVAKLPVPSRAHWRVHFVLWAAARGLQIEGDFVECGVYTGIYSKSICEYYNFGARTDRKMYLLDSFEGVVEDLIGEEEKAYWAKVGKKINAYPKDFYDMARERFAEYPNVHLIKGMIPESLSRVPVEKIAYLSMDMNCSGPEIAAGEFFWPKMTSGAMIVLDDYGFRLYKYSKAAWDKFAKERGVMILSSPTGQGLIIKP